MGYCNLLWNLIVTLGDNTIWCAIRKRLLLNVIVCISIITRTRLCFDDSTRSLIRNVAILFKNKGLSKTEWTEHIMVSPSLSLSLSLDAVKVSMGLKVFYSYLITPLILLFTFLTLVYCLSVCVGDICDFTFCQFVFV